MITIELDLPPGQAGRVFRHKAVTAHRSGRTRTTETGITWHDAPEGAPGAGAEALLLRDAGGWALERTIRCAGWPVGTERLATDDTATPHPFGADAPPRPIAALHGHTRSVQLAVEPDAPLVSLSLLEGTLRNVTDERPCCRLRLAGVPDIAARLALTLGETLPLAPAALSIGELARDIGGVAPAADPPAPAIAPDGDVDEALAALFGALAASLLFWLTRLGDAAADETRAVHQARVATRRLRSALIVFRDPLAGSLDTLRAPLKALAAVLGQARDWDVFLLDTGAALARGLAGDERVDALLAEAAAAREAAHASLRRVLARPATRRLLLHLSLLAALRPWREAAIDAATTPPALNQPPLTQPVGALAPHLLDKRFRKLVRVGKHLDGLDHAALHEVRKTAKKLRYALEFLAPTLPRGDTRRMLKLLAGLQDQLGSLNDIAVGATLMARIAPRGGPHDYAAGAVAGWLAAKAAAAQADLGETWRAVRHAERFWRG